MADHPDTAGLDGEAAPPSPQTILVSDSPGEVRWALMEDEGDRVLEIVHQRGALPDIGAVLAGRVRGKVPGHRAVFVDIGPGAPGFLAAENAPEGLPPEGRLLPVQVIREAVEEKGPKLTAACTLPGRLLVYTPQRGGIGLSPRVGPAMGRSGLRQRLSALISPGEGLIARTAAAEASVEALDSELTDLRTRWQTVLEAVAQAKAPGPLLEAPPPLDGWLDGGGLAIRRIVADRTDRLLHLRQHLAVHHPGWDGLLEHQDGDLFEDAGVAAVLEVALSPRVRLPGGGTLIIEETSAVTAIDVDAGPADPQETAKEAVDELARQIRLRGLAGQILIDFPRGRRGPDETVVRALTAALATDPLAPRVLGPTRGGLVEVVRQRRRAPLAHILLEAGGAPRLSLDTELLATLREALVQVPRHPGRTPVLSASPQALALLQGALAPAVAEAERRLGQPLRLEPWPADGPQAGPAGTPRPRVRLDMR